MSKTFFAARSSRRKPLEADRPFKTGPQRLGPLFAFVVLALTAGSTLASFVETAKLLTSNGEVNDRFGTAVAIEGDRLLAGAPTAVGRGQAFAFELQPDGSWLETQVFTVQATLQFGRELSLDGDRATISAPGFAFSDNNFVSFHERLGDGSWVEVERLLGADPPPGDGFGLFTALDGGRAAIAASVTETVFLFEEDGSGAWLEVAVIENRGGPLALDGDRLVVLGPNLDLGGEAQSAFVYEREPDGTWLEKAEVTADDAEVSDLFGCDLSLDGDRLLVGACGDNSPLTQSGSAYVFEQLDAASWPQVAKLVASDAAARDFLGSSVSLRGDRAAVGAPSSDFFLNSVGTVYLFERGPSGAWEQVQELQPLDGMLGDTFGAALELDEDQLVIGAPTHDAAGSTAGAVYVFTDVTVDPLLTLEGACPGTVTITLSGATPNASALLLGAQELGDFVVGGGPCLGTELELESPLLLPALPTDASGTASITRTVSGGLCGAFLQAVDQTTCSVSDVVEIGNE